MEIRKKQIDEIKDPKEKEAAIAKVQEDQMASVQKALEKEETSEKVQAMDAEQKALFGKSIYNVFIAVLKDKDAVTQANQILDIIKDNPTGSALLLNDVPKISDIIKRVLLQIDKASAYGSALYKFAQKNKIEVELPKSSSEKSKDVDI